MLKKKVVLLGDSAVGKASMVRRFVEDRYDDKYISTVGAKVSKKPMFIHIDGELVETIILLWDVIGSQGYTSTQAKHIAGADCAFLVHDLSRPATLKGLMNYWTPLLHKVTEGSPPPLMIAGNKSDLVDKEKIPTDRQVLKELLMSKSSSAVLKRIMPHPIGWKPASAKTGENVEECFFVMIWMMYRAHWKSGDGLDSIMQELGELKAEDIVWGVERNTCLSLADLIVAELPELGPREEALDILQACFAQPDFDKDNPSPEAMAELIECVATGARDRGFDARIIDHARKRWLSILGVITENEGKG